MPLDEQPVEELRIDWLSRSLLLRGRVGRLRQRRILHGLLTLDFSCQASLLHELVHLVSGVVFIQSDRFHHLVIIVIINRSWKVTLHIVDRQLWVRIRVTRFLDETLDLRQLVQFSFRARADFGTS